MSLVGKLAVVAKDYSKMGALIGQSKSGIKVYKTTMNDGCKTVLTSVDKDGSIIKKVVKDGCNPFDHSTKVYDRHGKLVRESKFDSDAFFSTTKFDKDGARAEKLEIDYRPDAKKVNLRLNDGDKYVYMSYKPAIVNKNPEFSVQCGKEAINDIYKGISEITLPSGHFDVINKSNLGEHLVPQSFSSCQNREFADILYNTFNKIFKMV